MDANHWIDGTLYPDIEPPHALTDMADRVDFLARLCAAWDFGVLPERSTLAEIRKPEWRDVVDECKLLTSPTYHLLRQWHELPALPYLGQRIPHIAEDASLNYV